MENLADGILVRFDIWTNMVNRPHPLHGLRNPRRVPQIPYKNILSAQLLYDLQLRFVVDKSAHLRTARASSACRIARPVLPPPPVTRIIRSLPGKR